MNYNPDMCDTIMDIYNTHYQVIDAIPPLVPNCVNCFIMSAQCQLLETENKILQDKIKTMTLLMTNAAELSAVQSRSSASPSITCTGDSNFKPTYS